MIEEEDGFGSINAAEPAVTYRQDEIGLYLDERVVFDYPIDCDPGIGPYTNEEMNARIDKAELDKNNPDSWVHIVDFWAAMQKEHLWL